MSYAQASKDLGIHPTQLRSWVKLLAEDPQYALPGHGRMKPEQLEIAQLKREVTKLKAERDSKKSPGLLGEGIDVKFGFVAKHRRIWPAEWLCEALGVSQVGFIPGWHGRAANAAGVKKSLARKFEPTSWPATGPGGCGTTCLPGASPDRTIDAAAGP